MGELIWTILTRQTGIDILPLQISIIKCWLLVITPRTIKLKYSTLIPILGQRNLRFPFAAGNFEIFEYLNNSFSIYRYAAVSSGSSVLIIGGGCDGDTGWGSTRIAKYTIDKWELVGNLQKDRFSPRAIVNLDRIVVVGGSSLQP